MNHHQDEIVRVISGVENVHGTTTRAPRDVLLSGAIVCAFGRLFRVMSREAYTGVLVRGRRGARRARILEEMAQRAAEGMVFVESYPVGGAFRPLPADTVTDVVKDAPLRMLR